MTSAPRQPSADNSSLPISSLKGWSILFSPSVSPCSARSATRGSRSSKSDVSILCSRVSLVTSLKPADLSRPTLTPDRDTDADPRYRVHCTRSISVRGIGDVMVIARGCSTGRTSASPGRNHNVTGRFLRRAVSPCAQRLQNPPARPEEGHPQRAAEPLRHRWDRRGQDPLVVPPHPPGNSGWTPAGSGHPTW